ncbi:hypothetical protein ACFX2J_027515 [Malus domestica]
MSLILQRKISLILGFSASHLFFNSKPQNPVKLIYCTSTVHEMEKALTKLELLHNYQVKHLGPHDLGGQALVVEEPMCYFDRIGGNLKLCSVVSWKREEFRNCNQTHFVNEPVAANPTPPPLPPMTYLSPVVFYIINAKPNLTIETWAHHKALERLKIK